MQLNPYLSFNGQCEAAFKFYERCLDGKIVAMMTYASSPMGDKRRPNGAVRSCMRVSWWATRY